MYPTPKSFTETYWTPHKLTGPCPDTVRPGPEVGMGGGRGMGFSHTP